VSDLRNALDALRKAHGGYVKAESYYEGTAEEPFASNVLRRALKKAGENFQVNFAKTPVDAVANRLEISAVTVPDSDTLTQMLQRKVWDVNDLLMEAPDIHRKACEYGDAYVTVWPGEEDGTVDVFYNSPTTTRVFYDQENHRRKSFAVKAWIEGNYKRANLYYPDRIERFITKNEQAKGEDEEDWIPFVEDDEEWPIDNPFGVVPIFHFRTARPYGRPEHKDAYGPQNAINKLVVTQMATTDYLGFPQRYALADPTLEPDEDGDDFSLDADTQNDSEFKDNEQPKLKSGPGELWWLQGVKGVGQFDTADVDNFLKPMDAYIRMMAQVTTTPLDQFAPTGQHPTGESRRQQQAPLIKKARERQMSFAGTWSEVFSFALQILGHEDIKVDVRWVPAHSVDDKAGWETNKAKVDAGVPLYQVLLESGYTEQQLNAWGIQHDGNTR
jgi:hypothetical protein